MQRPSAPSFRLEMLQVARLGPKILGESAGLVKAFALSKLMPEGGFCDRAGRADLYYSVFGLEVLLALQCDLPVEATMNWLRGFGDGDGLDFVHLCSLARCAANVGGVYDDETARVIASRMDAYRTPDGGFHGTPGKSACSAYGCLLAWGAYSDLRVPLANAEALTECMANLVTPDGGFANERYLGIGSTTATAAALTLCKHMGKVTDEKTAAWLRARQMASGGFLAAPNVPLPDLLSTAVALHALADAGELTGDEKERALDFVDSLWNADGGFHGHWADDELDLEYTYYGLLALGHLSLV